MTKTFGAFALAVALIAGAGAASAMPHFDGNFDFETVFEPQN
ncbi:MAG: hypothetical protein ACTSP0_00055 [Alphaproteobacteria bacterium]